jgi:selenide,water dikinase
MSTRRPDPVAAATGPPIRLTELTECGGCAAKLGADLLAGALAGLGAADAPPELVAGLDPPDDAAAYVVAPDLAILGTLDFFPPLVDDPATFGSIAAANACSDVLAMGGRVLFALSIAAFPEGFPTDALRAVLDGAAATVREAGGLLAGGHTIRDPEPKYGLAVIGAAHPDRLLRKGGAQPGDVLVLTKPLGTGLLVSGRRGGRTTDAWLDTAIVSMRRLNRVAAEVLVRRGLRGATDVTGFGLLGHAAEMARASGSRFVIELASLPTLDGALEVAAAGVETAGAGHNRRSVAPLLEPTSPPGGEGPTGSDATDGPGATRRALEAVAYDPQTSGGLLAAVPPGSLDAVLADLRAVGVEPAVIGRVEASDRPAIALR